MTDEMVALRAQLEKANEEAANFATDALRLERERDEARAWLDEYRKQLGCAEGETITDAIHQLQEGDAASLKRERDEARAQLAENILEVFPEFATDALRWTTEPPTTPGWYWCDRGEPFRSRGDGVVVVEVCRMPDGSLQHIPVGGSGCYVRCDQTLNWCPIPKPPPKPEDGA